MSYINPTPGSAGVQATLKLKSTNSSASDTWSGALSVPAMQDITLNNANDVFSWTQLDSGSKFQLATTSTNDVSINVVLDGTSFFGTAPSGATDTAAEAGIFGLSKNKIKVAFDLFIGPEDDGSNGKYISGEGYVTGLSPTVSADSPVWVSPVTISVTGDYTVGTAAQTD